MAHKQPGPVSIEELAEGYCKSIRNARRLIDDGKALIDCDRFLGSINCFRLAMEELAKAHLINQAVCFADDDEGKWKRFWDAFRNHKPKMELIEYELHWASYEDIQKFDDRIKTLIQSREDSIYVKYEPLLKKFFSPEETMLRAGDLNTTAILEYDYALRLFNIFSPGGAISEKETLAVFKMQRKEKGRKENI